MSKHKEAAIERARHWLDYGFLVLDTETTGLKNADPVEISLITSEGEVVLNTRCQPDCEIEQGAANIHGITLPMLRNAPTLQALLPRLASYIEGRLVLVYNAGYDIPIVHRIFKRYNIDCDFDYDCVMLAYADYFGQWDNYRRSYKWQKLPGGDHSALGDCHATLGIVHKMAQLERVTA